MSPPSAFTERQADRERMVESQLKARDIRSSSVLAAMAKVPRHALVPSAHRHQAYADHPLPIGEGQTISQPYIVAFMTEAAQVKRGEKVLEIGTGSGYQAAVLAELGAEVFTIEIVAPLAERAKRDLHALGYDGIRFRTGDGYQGWASEAPFDAVIVTAAPGHVPQPLVDQLALGGRMVIPVGDYYQELKVYERDKEGVKSRSVMAVRFVPMTGEAQRQSGPPEQR